MILYSSLSLSISLSLYIYICIYIYIYILFIGRLPGYSAAAAPAGRLPSRHWFWYAQSPITVIIIIITFIIVTIIFIIISITEPLWASYAQSPYKDYPY